MISLARIGPVPPKMVSCSINRSVCSSSNISSFHPTVGSELTQGGDTTNEPCGNDKKKYGFCQQELGVNQQKDDIPLLI